MTTIIEQAKKGRRKAMTALYESSKQNIYHLSCLLLGSEEKAADVTQRAYKSSWNAMSAYGIKSEEDFVRRVSQKAVGFAKGEVNRQNENAFHVTKGHIPLPLQRFVYVLHTAGGYSTEEIAAVLKIDRKTVALALKTKPENLPADCLPNSGEEIPVPKSVDQAALDAIRAFAAPFEKKRTKQVCKIGAAALAACLLVVCLIVAILRKNHSETPQNENSATNSSTDSSADASLITEPVIDLDDSLTYFADIAIQDYGTVTVKLDQNAAPVTVSNFINLAQNGFYNGLTFHRIMEGFMMQGGDPNGNGTGGSSRCITGEFSANGYDNPLSHTRGAISMARSGGNNDSASSQFFIVQQDSSSSLDGQYAAFGYVTEGMDVVDDVCEAARPTDNNGSIAADEQPVITSVTIRTE